MYGTQCRGYGNYIVNLKSSALSTMSLEFRQDDWWVIEEQATHKLKDYPFWGSYEVQNYRMIKLTRSKSLTRTNCTHKTSNQPQEIKQLIQGEVLDKQHKGKTNSPTPNPKFAYLNTASSLMQHNSIREFHLFEKAMQHLQNYKLQAIWCDNSISPRRSCGTEGEKVVSS
jgi:hypothetical protein